MLVEPYVGCHERHIGSWMCFFTSLSHEKETLSRRKHRISNEMCVFCFSAFSKGEFRLYLRLNADIFYYGTGENDYMLKGGKILRNTQCLYSNNLLRYLNLMIS